MAFCPFDRDGVEALLAEDGVDDAPQVSILLEPSRLPGI
jgi:hypothetical protein